MSALAPAPSPSPWMLKVLSGPDKGVAFQLLPPRVTIGRDPESHVVLSDTRCSRHQAVLEFTIDGVYIQDVSGRSNLFVNDHLVVDRTLLGERDLVRIGDSHLRLFQSHSIVTQMDSSIGPSPELRARTSHSSASSGRLRFYTIIALVGLVLFYFLSSENAKKKDEQGIKTESDIQEEIAASEKRISEEAVSLNRFRNDEEKQRYEEAQKHYLQGFRDFQKGQYTRALKAFETARAIEPSHKLAEFYYSLAARRRDEIITLQMLEGRQYKEKLMYARCSAALEKVLIEINNPQDLKFKEAATLKKECDMAQQRRF